MSENNTKMVRYKPPPGGYVPSDEERAELRRLEEMGDEGIDFSDIPPITAEQFANARRGGPYKAVKQPVTIRLDADVVGWFKDKAGDAPYQTEINRVLRQHVARQLVQDRKKRA